MNPCRLVALASEAWLDICCEATSFCEFDTPESNTER
jgi:hypothetical protein